MHRVVSKRSIGTFLNRTFPGYRSRWASNVPFLLADIGEGIQEVEVLQWHVGVGDTLQQFDKVCEVQSDKAVVEITSRYEGVVTSLADNDIVKVGEPLLHLNTEDETETTPPIKADDDSSTSSSETEGGAAVEESVNGTNDTWLDVVSTQSSEAVGLVKPLPLNIGSLQMSPAVRKLIHDHSIDAAQLHGTGPNGRVLKADVLKLLQKSTTTSSAANAEPIERSDSSVDGDVVIPLRGYTRIMFDSMTASLQRPHMSLTDELYVGEAWKIAPGIKFLSVLIKAVSKGLERYPSLNAISNVDKASGDIQLVRKAAHNIGVAMDTPNGLVVPVLHNVQNLSVSEIQAQLDIYKQQASFERSQLSQATFTLSNIGSTGAGLHATAVLGGDAVAMGVVGRKHTTPVFLEGNNTMIPTPTVKTSWTADHRFVDGATLAKFHTVVRGYVETPTKLLVELR